MYHYRMLFKQMNTVRDISVQDPCTLGTVKCSPCPFRSSGLVHLDLQEYFYAKGTALVGFSSCGQSYVSVCQSLKEQEAASVEAQALLEPRCMVSALP